MKRWQISCSRGAQRNVNLSNVIIRVPRTDSDSFAEKTDFSLDVDMVTSRS